MRTVTYGVSSAPYLALRTLLFSAEKEQNNFPNAAKVFLEDIYVDNIVTGCSTIEEALAVKMNFLNYYANEGLNYTNGLAIILKSFLI